MKIHPTALVSPGAQLGEGAEVGAFAIIEDGVVLGAHCTVQAHAVLTSRVTIGDHNFIGYGSIIGAAPQDFAHTDAINSEVRIGSHNTLREYVTIHRGSKDGTATIVGDHNYLMTGTHLAHNVQLGNKIVIANNCLLAGYATIGDEAVLGGGSVYHQHLRVGRSVMIRGGTAWSKDIPPYVVGPQINTVAGLNVIGLKRSGMSPQARQDIKRAFNLFYRSGLNVTQAIEQSEQSEWAPEAQVFFDFVKTKSKRGLCRLRSASSRTSSDAAAADEE